MSEFLTALEATLKQVVSPSSGTSIKEASASLEKNFYSNPQIIPALVEILQKHPEPQLRQLSGVEVNKQIQKSWQTALDKQTKAGIRQSLLESTFQEENPLVRHTSSRVISNIAMIDLEADNEWPELPQLLLNGTQSENPAHREVAVYIMYTLLDGESEYFLKSDTEILQTLQILSQTVNDSASKQVRVSSVLALGGLASTIDASVSDSRIVTMFQNIFPSLVEVLNITISDDDEKNAMQVFEVFNDLVSYGDIALISKHFNDLLHFMAQDVAASESLSEEYRNAALQFLHAAVRSRRNKTKQAKLGPFLTSILVKVVAQPVDAEDLENDGDDDDEETPSLKALKLLDVLSTSLPPSHVMKPFLQAFPSLVTSTNKFERYAGFKTLSVTVEGAPETVSQAFASILPLLVQGLQDQELLVRVSALDALCQLSVELHSVVGDEHEVLLPLVLNIMDSANSVKTAKAACQALDATLETMDSDIITENYLPVLVPKLLQLFSGTDDLSVKGSIVNAIASAAFSAGKNYDAYFEQTIKTFEPFLSACSSSPDELTEEQATLCSSVIDCIGSLAGAIGKEKFAPFVEPITKAVISCLGVSTGRLKESTFVIVSIFARMYEQDFAAFLPQIMPTAFECLEMQEFTVNEGDDDEDGTAGVGVDDDEDVMEKILKNYNVNTALAVEKEVILDSIAEIITGTKQSFAPYLEKTIEIMQEFVDHFYVGIRKGAFTVIWKAFITFYRSYNPAKWTAEYPSTVQMPDVVVSLAATARKNTLDTLSEEEDSTLVVALCELLAEALKAAGPVVLGNNREELEGLCGDLVMLLNKEHCCQVMGDELDDLEQEEGGDEEDAEQDRVVIDYTFDVLIAISKAIGRNFSPILSTIMPIVSNYVSSANEKERVLGFGCIAEVCEGLEHDISPFTTAMFPLFLTGLDDRDLEVRSISAYGTGLLCYFTNTQEGIQVIQPQYLAILGKLQKLLKKVDKAQRKLAKKSKGEQQEQSDDNALTETNYRGIANACGCVARMTLAHPDWVPVADVVPALVQLLPIYEGFEENDPILDLLLWVFSQKHEAVLAPLLQQPLLVNVLQEMFEMQKEADAKVASRSHSYAYTEDPTAYYTARPFQEPKTLEKAVALLRAVEAVQPGSISQNESLKQFL